MNDTIYRQAAIEVASRECQEWRGIFARIEDGLKALPPAQPEQKTGKWILYGRGMAGCSQCGMIYNDVYDDDRYFNFCPNCGTKMEGQDEQKN